jgi:hypothetical protein
MDEHAGDLEPVAATLMHADAPVLMLNADARSRIGGFSPWSRKPARTAATASGIEISPLSSSALMSNAILSLL